jgi:1,4-dihydroxy-2-naphthoyl-CoA synthase
MKGSAIKRIQVNLGILRQFKKNFCHNPQTNIHEHEKKPPTKRPPYEGVLFHKHNNHLMEIVLNEPKKLNSLDIKMIKSLLRKVRLWLPENISSSSSDEDKSERERSKKADSEEEIPRVVLMSGAGGKAFCAGGDVAALCKAKKENANDKVLKDFFRSSLTNI